MARTALEAVLVAGTLAISGCAPWSRPTTTDYVTVERESGSDSSEAQKLYNKARRQMTKHERGEKCDLAKAEKLLQQSLATDVRFGPAHHRLGVLYFWQHKLYLAAWEFEYAARLMPDRFEPLNNLGLVYESAGKLDQAKMYYCLAREKAESQPQVIGNQARVALRSGQSVDEIRPMLDDVVATDTRPEWRRWARELLGIHPQSELSESCDLPCAECHDSSVIPSISEPLPVEGLPLIAPPRPRTASPSGTIHETTQYSVGLEPSPNGEVGGLVEVESGEEAKGL